MQKTKDLLNEKERIDKELDKVIEEAYRAGLSKGASSYELYRFAEGNLNTEEIIRLEQIQNGVRNNRDYDAIENEIKAIREKQKEIGKKRTALINQKRKINEEIEEEKYRQNSNVLVPNMPFKKHRPMGEPFTP